MFNKVRWRVSLTLIGLLLFMSKVQAEEFNVGVGVHPDGFYGTPEEFISLLKKYNINSLRTDYKWSLVEKVKGEYKAPDNKTEKVLDIAYTNGVNPIVILDYGNEIYGKGKPVTDEQISAFSRYAAWTVRHFKGKAAVFEVWNEWSNRVVPDANSDESARNYVRLVRAVSKVIKKENPQAIVIAGSFNPMDYIDLRWGKQLIKLGILNDVDGLSIHPYTWGSRRASTPEINMKMLEKTQQELMDIAKRKSEIPFYITEMGFPSTEKNPVLSQQEIASYAYHYILLSKKKNYIKGVWWYDFINDGNNKNYREHNFGILNRDLSEKASADAIKNAVQSISSGH
jgi:hypothetical protein